jgi:hypothetical protein
MPERVADLRHSIKDEHDPKKFTALIGELIRVLDEERSISAWPADSLHHRGLAGSGVIQLIQQDIADARSLFDGTVSQMSCA